MASSTACYCASPDRQLETSAIFIDSRIVRSANKKPVVDYRRQGSSTETNKTPILLKLSSSKNNEAFDLLLDAGAGNKTGHLTPPPGLIMQNNVSSPVEEEGDSDAVYWHENACYSEVSSCLTIYNNNNNNISPSFSSTPVSYSIVTNNEVILEANPIRMNNEDEDEAEIVFINKNSKDPEPGPLNDNNGEGKTRLYRKNSRHGVRSYTIPSSASESAALSLLRNHQEMIVLDAVLEEEDDNNNNVEPASSTSEVCYCNEEAGNYVKNAPQNKSPSSSCSIIKQLHNNRRDVDDYDSSSNNNGYSPPGIRSFSSSSSSSPGSNQNNNIINNNLSEPDFCEFSFSPSLMMASSDVVAIKPPVPATTPSSPPAMRSRPRLPAISYINRPNNASNTAQGPVDDQLAMRARTISPATLVGSDPFLAGGGDNQQCQVGGMSVLKSDFAQKYRRPLVSPVRAQTQLQACSPPPVALPEHLSSKQRRKLSSPLIFRPINDGYPVPSSQQQDGSVNISNSLINTSSGNSPAGQFAPLGASAIFDQPSMTSMSLLGPTSTTTSSTTSSSSRETLVPQPPLTPVQAQTSSGSQFLQQIPSSSSSSSSPQNQQQLITNQLPSDHQQSAQHVSRRIKSLADRLRGSSFESSSPESKAKAVSGGELVESSSSEEQRVLSLQNEQAGGANNKRPRSQSPRVTLSQQMSSSNKTSPNNLSGGNVHCSLSSSMESQGFSEALTTSTDSAGSATQTTSTAGTMSSASGTMTTRASFSANTGPGSIASTVVSNSAVVRHSSLRSQTTNPRSDSHSPAADSSTGEYNVSSGAEDTSRRQSLMTGAMLMEFQAATPPIKAIELPPSRISTLTRRKPRLDIFGLDLLAKRGSIDTFTALKKNSDENVSEVSPLFPGQPYPTSRRPSRSHQAQVSGRFLTHPISKAESSVSQEDQGSGNQLNSDSQIASQSPTMTALMQASMLSEQSASCGNVDELMMLMPQGDHDERDDQEKFRQRQISSSAGSFQVDFLSDQDDQNKASGDSTSPSNNNLSTSPSAFVQASSTSVEFMPPNSGDGNHLRAEDQFGGIHMTSRRGGSKKQRRHQQQQMESQLETQNTETQIMREVSPSSITTATTTTERREAMVKLHSQSGKITPAISPAPAPTAVSARLAEIFGTSRSTVVGAAAAFSHRPPAGSSGSAGSAGGAASRTTSTSSTGTAATPLSPTNVTSASVLQTSMSSLHSQQSGESDAKLPATRQVSSDLLEAQDTNAAARGSSPNKDASPIQPPPPQAAVPKRKLIVDEFYSVEKEYVEALKILVEKYLTPLKAQDVLETPQVDDIFYKIPEFYAHHSIFLTFLEKAWKNWHDMQTIGDIINMIFSKESVVECYMSFIENYSRSEKALESALQTNSAFKKFVEIRQRESKSKLDLKSLIIQPAQRLPRYLLLLKRLIGNTPEDHPDYRLLGMAEKTIHNLTEKIEQSKKGESLLDTLRKIEQILLTDQQLCSPDRYYIRQDIVQIQGRKEQSCIWLFSDLAIFSTFKRKGGPASDRQRKSILLNTPFGQDFADLLKHKTWLRIGLDDLELKMVQPNALKKVTPEQGRIEADMQVLQQIIVLLRQLSADQGQLSEQVSELLQNRNRQLVEITNRSQQSLMELATLDLVATTPQGEFTLTVGFVNPEKKQAFETSFLEARQRLSATSGRRVPQFIHYLPVMKIRQGMTFTFCAATEDFNSYNCRDIWIVNSDGYLDNVCLLSLQPEPSISQNTSLPGCSGQIYCICSVPATSVAGQPGGRSKTAMPGIGLIKAASNAQSNAIEESDTESSPSEAEEADEIRKKEHGLLANANMTTSISSGSTQIPNSQSLPSTISNSSGDLSTKQAANPVLDGSRATIWFGTEDGIYIFPSQDNIKTTKNRARIQFSAACLAIVYVDNKVFASLSNGDIVLIRREPRSFWEITRQVVIPPLGTSVPASRLTVVTGNIWCARQNVVHVLDPVSLAWQHTFQIGPDLNRSVTAMAPSGHAVWVATQNSDKLYLYHANSRQVFLEVCVVHAVAQRLSTFDDIIKQHKLACLHVTSLHSCKDLLWVGTSAGVLLTITSPRLGSTPPKGPIPHPAITALSNGHAGQVRILAAIEMPVIPSQKPPLPASSKTSSLASLAASTASVSSVGSLTAPNTAPMGRRLSTTTATLATKMLVISGGEGYENLQNPASPGEDGHVGKEDNTNHILLWEV